MGSDEEHPKLDPVQARALEPKWVCNYCGNNNQMSATHCFLCTSPSDEYLEQMKEEEEEKRERKRAEERRSSRSVERERKRKEDAEKRARFIKYMDEDGRERPCVPQHSMDSKRPVQMGIGHMQEGRGARSSLPTER